MEEARVRIVVFGASGGTGRQLLAQGAERGHEMTAFARNPPADEGAGARWVRGDVLEPDDVRGALKGADAVLSALGIGFRRHATTVYSAGTAHIMAAMHAEGARRLLCVSTTSLQPPPWSRSPAQRLLASAVLHPLLRRPYGDMALMERAVMAEDTLDWTVVRAARLTDGRRTGRYRTAPGGALRGAWSISRADVADCLLRHLDAPEMHRSVVDVAY